jgi:7,8-dihydropterin-6-yl-methyl-4-(beta-D-ribofuranosyl)aminobenzene 5'-phosphate synthase
MNNAGSEACSNLETPAPMNSAASGKIAFGQCKSVTITCVSEIGWHSNARLVENIQAGGGMQSSQWQIPWDGENARGSCSLLEVEALDGTRRRLLIDTGWNADYMRERFAATGVDKLLAAGEIEALFISHEHIDHLFGLQAVLELRPGITIYVPAGFQPEGFQFLAGTSFPQAGARNAIAHTGRVIRLGNGGVHQLMPGLAAVGFDLPIILGIAGEQSLYAAVQDKGLVSITGCGHQTLARIVEFAQSHLAGGDRLHGLYGGLHLAPFGELAATQEAVIRGMAQHGFERIACNHCTGLPAVQLMTELGYPVVKGTGSQGSASDLYICNGDSVTFG